MNMLTSYDQAMSALSTALQSKDVAVVLKGRRDIDLIKLRARQLRDRKLLADAMEFQMRVERWLGVLLINAKNEGHLRDGRPSRSGEQRPATLAELGVKDFEVGTFTGIFGPSGMPAPVVAKLTAALKKALAMDAVREDESGPLFPDVQLSAGVR